MPQFPMSSSIYGSKASSSEREGGLAMHTKMLRYARVITVRLYLSVWSSYPHRSHPQRS